MRPIPYTAMILARSLHREQRRKYTNEPYIVHLAEVAGIVASVNANDAMLCCAWLHDCMEDQGIKPGELTSSFGADVDFGVTLLSDLEEGNRATRKALSRERLAAAPDWVQTIKCADLISNTNSIVQHDPNFAVVYLAEKRLLLDVMTKADPRLHAMARQIVERVQP